MRRLLDRPEDRQDGHARLADRRTGVRRLRRAGRERDGPAQRRRRRADVAGSITSASVLSGIQLGIMQACLDVVLPYVRERKQFGQPIGAFQLMQAKVADMYVALNSARAYVYAVARACDAGKTTRFDAAGAILLATENAVKVAGEAIQALGGAGYTKDWPVERYPARRQAARHRRRHQRDPPHADRPRADRRMTRRVRSDDAASTAIDATTPFRANAAHNRALADELRATVGDGGAGRLGAAPRAPRRARQAAAARPGRAAARSRLAVPRDRPARRQRPVRRRGARRGHDRRHRPRLGPRGDDRLPTTRR